MGNGKYIWIEHVLKYCIYTLRERNFVLFGSNHFMKTIRTIGAE